VPISVTALTQESMDQLGIKDFQDVGAFTPGVTIDNSGTNAISIRGISSSGGAGTTGIYIDDTPIQMRSVGFNPDDTLPKTFDLQRVEVLRGPQGTLFGAGAEGGAVRYILTQPSVTGRTPMCAARSPTRSTASRASSSASRAGSRSSMARSGCAPASGTGTTAAGSTASTRRRRRGQPQHQLFQLHHGAVGGGLAANQQPHHHSELALPETGQARRVDLLDGVFQSGQGAVQHGDARAHRRAGRLLPASAKIQWDLGKSQIISNTAYFYRKQLTAYQGTVYDLSYWQSSVGGCTSNQDPGCPWYPLIDASGIHLPAGPAGNADTQYHDEHTAELHAGAPLAVV